MKTLKLFFILFIATISGLHAQGVVGKWQLIKQTTCIEENLSIEADSTQMLIEDMKSMGGVTPQIVTFKQKGTGEESTRILSKRKHVDNKNFLYRFTGDNLLILDKRSQTISEMYIVDKVTSDSLILSNSAQPCETKIFVKIKSLN